MSLYSEATYILTPNQYAASSLFALKPVDGSGDMFVDRGSYANRVNSSGLLEYMSNNVPRLDYSNGGCPSILVETQRTNFVTYSNDFSNAAWTKLTTTITPNYAISPDGNTNASRVQFNAPSSQLYQPVGVQPSSVASFYVKGIAGETIAIYNSFNGGGLYELRTLTGQWQRISVASVGTISSYIAISNFFGATATDVLVYGGQFELGSYATSYIPTESATVTRVFDSMTKTDIYNLVGVNQGTLFAEYKASVEGEVAKTISLYNTNSPNQIVYLNISQTAGRIQGTLWNGSTSYTSFVTPVVQTDMNKIALIWGGGTMQLFVNNVAGNIVSTTGTFDGFNRLALNYFNGLYLPTGFVKSLMVWDRPLTISEIAQL
jgi:hypothetical protein